MTIKYRSACIALSILTFCATFLLKCSSTNPIVVVGSWVGNFQIGEKEIPFNVRFTQSDNQLSAIFTNAQEEIIIDEVSQKGDSLYIVMNVFDTEFRLKKVNSELIGVYQRNYELDYIIPVKFEKSDTRFEPSNNEKSMDISGQWQTLFSDSDGHFPAIGSFEQTENRVSGTFLTETGDYRYLEGIVDGEVLKLSTFDGSHAFLFEASLHNDTLKGGFWSGNHYYASWYAIRNPSYSLTHADSLTFLKEGYQELAFTFLNDQGKPVSLNDFKGKPTIVQILGTWCPNCMDETQFLAGWLSDYPESDLQIIGLSYEYGNDADYAYARINKLKDKMNVPYPILYAGSNDKAEASKTLPMLNKIVSFPTLIFLNSAHEIKRIHTGFTGPGTGQTYIDFKQEFEKTIDSLK